MASDNGNGNGSGRNGSNGNGRNGNGHRTDAERDIHRAQIMGLILRNPRMKQNDIAAQLGVDRSTVSRDITFIRKDAVNFYREGWESHTARLLAEFMELARTGYEGYDESREDGSEVSTLSGSGKGGSLTRNTVKTISKYGDPRFLLVVEAALRREGEILGIFEAEKIKVSGEISIAQAIKFAKTRREERENADARKLSAGEPGAGEPGGGNGKA